MPVADSSWRNGSWMPTTHCQPESWSNRLWQYHFGRGIVPTPNDFGRQGKPPSHPASIGLFGDSVAGWWMVTEIHASLDHALQRLSPIESAQQPAILLDPANQWLAGFPRQRLDAESIRDSLLSLGGNLDLAVSGPHPFPDSSSWDFTQHKPFKAVYESLTAVYT